MAKNYCFWIGCIIFSFLSFTKMLAQSENEIITQLNGTLIEKIWTKSIESMCGSELDYVIKPLIPSKNIEEKKIRLGLNIKLEELKKFVNQKVRMTGKWITITRKFDENEQRPADESEISCRVFEIHTIEILKPNKN